jgi:UTP--glucose-1-phosphate uridylyltransferase
MTGEGENEAEDSSGTRVRAPRPFLPHPSIHHPSTKNTTQALLSKTAVLKLNGGLGTSMGLAKAKALLEVKPGASFLDLIARQVKHLRETTGSHVRFILMNSFSTADDTREFLKSRGHGDLVDEPDAELLQNKSPKLDAKTLEPISWPADPELEWCPPGHGDVYPSLAGSGLLDRLLAAGVDTLFVSNADNLGATLDLALLAHFARSGAPFLMEVAPRTEADKKGGHLARRAADGRLLLRESAQCRPEDKAAFEDVAKHAFFNTNNLWVNLPALKAALDASGVGALRLPLIKNAKTVDPRDGASPAVYQLETAMGSAIELFDGASAVVVPRTRFAPVKTTSDLFLLRSDAYAVTPASTVEPTVTPLPKVDLDAKAYKLVDDYERLVPVPPSLAGAKSVRVKGPVRFVAGTVLKGDVLIVNEGGGPVDLAPGEYADCVVPVEEAKEAAVA